MIRNERKKNKIEMNIKWNRFEMSKNGIGVNEMKLNKKMKNEPKWNTTKFKLNKIKLI